MYIQITDHCNMACAHCGFSCGPRKRRFMSMDTFEKALEYADSEFVAIGGGEPTLHPQFWAFIGFALGKSESVWLATNGSQTKTALILANMAKRGILGCELSQDAYHDEIDQRVVDAFDQHRRPQFGRGDDRRGVRDVSWDVVRAGRAARTGVWNEEGCVCDGFMIDPDGVIFSCGCKRLRLGDVHSGWNLIGMRLNETYKHDEWEEVNTSGCLFHHKNKKLYRSFVKWLKEDGE